MAGTIQQLTSMGRALRRPGRNKVPVAAALIGVGFGAFALGMLLTGKRRIREPTLKPEPTRRHPVTQATVKVNPADTHMGEPGRNDDERLDEAIQESFPGSDPVSVRIE